MAESQIQIQMTLTQTQCLNRGIQDVMRSTTLMPDGSIILDFEGYAAGYVRTGDVVGSWVVTA